MSEILTEVNFFVQLPLGNPKGAMITHRNAIGMLSGLVYIVEQVICFLLYM